MATYLGFPPLQIPDERVWFYCGTAFITSLIFAPLSIGIIYFFIFVAIYQLIFGWYNRHEVDIWTNLGVVAASILGYIIGWSFVNERHCLDDVCNFSWSEEKKRWQYWMSYIS